MLYVSIGRNVGEVPMSDDKWAEFQNEVADCIEREVYVSPDTIAHGNSRYGSMREETCVMVWFDVNSHLFDVTLMELEEVAVKYGQECIAWSVSMTEFIDGVKYVEDVK